MEYLAYKFIIINVNEINLMLRFYKGGGLIWKRLKNYLQGNGYRYGYSFISSCGGKTESPSGGDTSKGDKVKVGVVYTIWWYLYFNSSSKLRKITIWKLNKVEFTFYDGKGDQATQNDSIDTLLQKDVIFYYLI
jgi:hypothetical protein